MAFKYAISNTYAHATFAAANSVVEVSNSIITITAGDGLSGGGSFGLNNPDNASVTLSATSSSGGGLSSGGGGLSISAGNGLFTNTEGLQVKANTGITVNQDGIFANGSALFPSINDTGTQTNLYLSDGYSYFPNTYLEVGKTQAPGTLVTTEQAVGLRLTAEANTISSNVSLSFGSLDTGNNGRHGAIINFKKEGLWTAGSGNYPGNLEFYTRPASGNQVLALVIDSTQNFDFQSGNITTTGILTVGSDTFTGDAPATIEIDASQYVAMNVRGYNATGVFEAPQIKIQRNRGSKSNPSATLSGDVLGYLDFAGNDGTSTRNASYITVTQDAAISTGRIQSSFNFNNGTGTGNKNTFNLNSTTADFRDLNVTTTGSLTCDAFTTVDPHITMTAGAAIARIRGDNTGTSIYLEGGTGTADGSRVEVHGAGAAAAGDVWMYGLSNEIAAQYDYSADTWNFQDNAITTTGIITINNANIYQSLATDTELNSKQYNSIGGRTIGVDNGTGLFFISQTSNAGVWQEHWITCSRNAEVKLHYNGASKLETTSTGISVTGDVVATGDISGDLKRTVRTTDINSATYQTIGTPYVVTSSDVGQWMPVGGTTDMYIEIPTLTKGDELFFWNGANGHQYFKVPGSGTAVTARCCTQTATQANHTTDYWRTGKYSLVHIVFVSNSSWIIEGHHLQYTTDGGSNWVDSVMITHA